MAKNGLENQSQMQLIDSVVLVIHHPVRLVAIIKLSSVIRPGTKTLENS